MKKIITLTFLLFSTLCLSAQSYDSTMNGNLRGFPFWLKIQPFYDSDSVIVSRFAMRTLADNHSTQAVFYYEFADSLGNMSKAGNYVLADSYQVWSPYKQGSFSKLYRSVPKDGLYKRVKIKAQ